MYKKIKEKKDKFSQKERRDCRKRKKVMVVRKGMEAQERKERKIKIIEASNEEKNIVKLGRKEGISHIKGIMMEKRTYWK